MKKNGMGFEPVLNWFQSTELTTQLQLRKKTVNKRDRDQDWVILIKRDNEFMM